MSGSLIWFTLNLLCLNVPVPLPQFCLTPKTFCKTSSVKKDSVSFKYRDTFLCALHTRRKWVSEANTVSLHTRNGIGPTITQEGPTLSRDRLLKEHLVCYWYVFGVQLVSHWWATAVPLVYHWYTTGVALKYHWYATDMLLLYHCSAICKSQGQRCSEARITRPECS